MLWVQITRTRLTYHLRSHDGSLTFPTGTPEDHPRGEEEENHHHVPQDHPPEVVEVVEVVEVAEEEEGVECSHYPDTHLPNQLKNF